MCTSLSYIDASNAVYVGRTLEFAGSMPWQLSYFPKGLKFTSVINDKNGISYKNSLAFIGITLPLSNTTSKSATNYQDFQVVHGLNEAGLNFGANAFPLAEGIPIKPNNISSALALIDVGTWALGQFKTVADVKAALNRQLI